MPTSLPPIQVTVIRSGGEWRLLRDGQDAGHYDYSVDALDAALLRASQLLGRGREVEVFIQNSAFAALIRSWVKSFTKRPRSAPPEPTQDSIEA